MPQVLAEGSPKQLGAIQPINNIKNNYEELKKKSVCNMNEQIKWQEKFSATTYKETQKS